MVILLEHQGFGKLYEFHNLMKAKMMVCSVTHGAIPAAGELPIT